MGFSLFEISSFLGRPVCLYEFQWGNTVYLYTSADRDLPYGEDDDDNPIIWTKLAISDSGFTQGVSAEDFVITMPRNNPLIDLFRLTPPSLPITIVCRRFHYDDPDEEATVYWSGTLGNVKGKDAISVEVLGVPISRTTRRTGLRLCWGRGCPHSVYDEGCTLDPELFKVETTITGLTSVAIDVASFGIWGGSAFAGGYVEWDANDDGTIDRRAIESFPGALTLWLLGTTDRMEIGQAIRLYPGCDLTPTTCISRFNNLANHGGFEMLADKSPFDGDPVF